MKLEMEQECTSGLCTIASLQGLVYTRRVFTEYKRFSTSFPFRMYYIIPESAFTISSNDIMELCRQSFNFIYHSYNSD